MNQNMLLINKKIGETPLEAINRAKAEDPSLNSRKTAYAGRLDPMARGLLLLLIDEECKNRDEYQGLDKVYEFELLLGIQTDTYDILGITESVIDTSSLSLDKIKESILKFQGPVNQEYPPYSSFHVEGKPLFWYAREGLLDTIKIPTKEVEIKKLEVLDQKIIESEDLLNLVEERISLVNGDFRQSEILSNWRQLLSNKNLKFNSINLRAKVTSGTYIRSLCNAIGKELGCGGIALDINRTAIGKFTIGDINYSD